MCILWIITVTSLHALHAFRIRQPQQLKFVLHSFGDPDNSLQSMLLREYQKLCRSFEKAIYTEADIPGITHVSPVLWAPWMETVWMGNHYEYRSAYFHDVMYSNNKPGQEGALLFSDPHISLQMTMLYQRYKRFDDSSYGTSNATLFNVFGSETLRIGRYKLPQSDEVILCITDPLTTSAMKRYLNSFNALKWFKAKFYQQMRKRQYAMRIESSSVPATAAPRQPSLAAQEPGNSMSKLTLDCSFLLDAIHKIEYGCAVEYLGEARARQPCTVPVLPVDLSDAFIVPSNAFATNATAAYNNHECNAITTSTVASKDSTAESAVTAAGSIPRPTITIADITGCTTQQTECASAALTLPIAAVSKQYVLESLWHTLLIYLSPRTATTPDDTSDRDYSRRLETMTLVMHSDGSPMSQIAAAVLRRVGAGNSVATVRVLPLSGANDVVTQSASSNGADMVVTCFTKGAENVLTGTFHISAAWRTGGAKIKVASGGGAMASLQRADWQEVLRRMRTYKSVRIVPAYLPA